MKELVQSMKRLIDLQHEFQQEHGDRISLDSPRFRFNSGFHDGTAAAEKGWDPLWDPRQHHDPLYVAAYFAGRDAWHKQRRRPQSSGDAWTMHLNAPWSEQAYLFIVSTDGDAGNLELTGATIADEDLGVLLHTDGSAERIGTGVVYARNQDGVMVELMLDMDEQSPIVREVEVTPHGVIYPYLSPGDELADNAALKP